MFKSEALTLQKKAELELLGNVLADLLGEEQGEKFLEVATRLKAWMRTPESYTPCPEHDEIIWNTGLHYAPEGQIIHAKVIGESEIGLKIVAFSDKTRGISGTVEVCMFERDSILNAYQAGGYGYYSDFTLVEPESIDG